MSEESPPVDLQHLPWAGEHLILCADRGLGARAVIAVDDTTRGPAMGGVRYAAYPSTHAAVAECVRLARAMTLKNAAAGLPFGGAKSVILRDGTPDRRALMGFFARNVALLGGKYIPGVDVGTTVDDLAAMAGIAPDIACHEEDPSPWTALGVFAGIRAAVQHAGASDIRGIRVVVQGAGHVGTRLVRLLAEEGAEIGVADIDPARVRPLIERFGATPVDPATAIFEPCDVLAPCAMARVINSESVEKLGCRIIAGAANDPLDSEAVADELADSGVLYVPDFLLSAGGVIHVHALRQGHTEDRLREDVLAIGERVRSTLDYAERTGVVPLHAAKTGANAVLWNKPSGVFAS